MHNQFDRDFDDLRKVGKEFKDFFKTMMAEGGCCAEPWNQKWHFEAKADCKPPVRTKTNVFSTADGSLVFEFLLPGFGEKDISLSFSGDTMVLKAKLPQTEQNKDDQSFDRKEFTLRDRDSVENTVSAEKYVQEAAKAVFKNGILTVTIPKKPEAPEPEGIKINITGDNT